MKEKDVEDAFCRWVELQDGGEVYGRQVRLSDGIADVIGCYRNVPFVAEIKLNEIDGSTFAQLFGYASQVEAFISEQWNAPNNEDYRSTVSFLPIFVGREMKKLPLRAAFHGYWMFIQYEVINDSITFGWINFPQPRISLPFSSVGVLNKMLNQMKQNYYANREG